MTEYAGELKASQRLNAGDVLRSPNGNYGLFMQGDGNLVLYAGQPAVPSAVWATNTWQLPISLRPTYAEMQDDGNFVLYNQARFPSWSTGTQKNPNARLVLQDDRNLVIYDANSALWSAHTAIVLPDQNQPVTRHEEQYIGWNKFLVSDATLYRDGTLTLSSTTRNRNPMGGQRARSLVVVQDAGGRAIWVSQEFVDPTRCSLFDPSCASDGTASYVEKFPDQVGRYAFSLDILVRDEESFVDLRNRFIQTIHTAKDLAPEIMAVVSLLG